MSCILALPNDLLRYICTFLKFNTNFPITCKQLYALSINIQCLTGEHLVQLVQTDRRLPVRCSCCTNYECIECKCLLIPMCVPTKCVYTFNKSGYVCDKCPMNRSAYFRTVAFEMDGLGWYRIYDKIV